MTEYRDSHAGRSAVWSGWVWFAGVLMIMMGAVNAFEGFVALFNKSYYVAGPNNALVFNVTGWGWVHLIIGALVLLAGIALLFDVTWARVFTVIVAGVEVIGQLAFIGVYPLWSIIAITLSVLVIWAIVVHGEESRINL